MQVLGSLHLLGQGPLVAALIAVTVAAAALPRREAHAAPREPVVTLAVAPLVVAAGAALTAAVLAAYWLPVWQWDALGYHLPYVNFALVAHGWDGVPEDMPYVSTYPHVIETFVIALRAMLPDDRLVDLAQVPFGLVGAAAAAGIARRMGAPRPEALAAGAAWLVVPAVFLQLPTDYVDVGSAAWLLVAIYFVLSAAQADAAHVPRFVAVGGLALGLFLGSKPSAPMATVIVLALLAMLAVRASAARSAVAALGLVALFGGGAFLANTLHHGNPVWPVEVTLGPLHLRGTSPMQHLLESGAAAPHLRGSLASRVVRSWTAMTSPPVFDMRIGGFGALFLAALPAAAVTLARLRKEPDRRALFALGALAATVATPDPAVARYVLALPAVVFALAAPRLAALSPSPRWMLGAVAGLVGVGQLVYAWPGLTGEGPPLVRVRSHVGCGTSRSRRGGWAADPDRRGAESSGPGRDVRVRRDPRAPLPRVGQPAHPPRRLDPRIGRRRRGRRLLRARERPARRGCRREARGGVVEAESRALPAPVPVQVRPMLGLRTPLKTLVAATGAPLLVALLVARSSAAAPPVEPPPNCSAVEQRVEETKQLLQACENDRQSVAADRDACGEELTSANQKVATSQAHTESCQASKSELCSEAATFAERLLEGRVTNVGACIPGPDQSRLRQPLRGWEDAYGALSQLAAFGSGESDTLPVAVGTTVAERLVARLVGTTAHDPVFYRRLLTEAVKLTAPRAWQRIRAGGATSIDAWFASADPLDGRLVDEAQHVASAGQRGPSLSAALGLVQAYQLITHCREETPTAGCRRAHQLEGIFESTGPLLLRQRIEDIWAVDCRRIEPGTVLAWVQEFPAPPGASPTSDFSEVASAAQAKLFTCFLGDADGSGARSFRAWLDRALPSPKALDSAVAGPRRRHPRRHP